MKIKIIGLIIFLMIFCTCVKYDPSIFPSYDILNPGEEVRMNPLRVTDDGNFVVNEAFLMWVGELKNEIRKLRKLKEK